MTWPTPTLVGDVKWECSGCFAAVRCSSCCWHCSVCGSEIYRTVQLTVSCLQAIHLWWCDGGMLFLFCWAVQQAAGCRMCTSHPLVCAASLGWFCVYVAGRPLPARVLLGVCTKYAHSHVSVKQRLHSVYFFYTRLMFCWKQSTHTLQLVHGLLHLFDPGMSHDVAGGQVLLDDSREVGPHGGRSKASGCSCMWDAA
jgi:hypothetical protein